LNQAKLDNVFAFHPPATTYEVAAHEGVREGCRSLSEILNTLVPDCHEKTIAMDKLREVMHWANAGIAVNGGVTPTL